MKKSAKSLVFQDFLGALSLFFYITPLTPFVQHLQWYKIIWGRIFCNKRSVWVIWIKLKKQSLLLRRL
jgi:hypothetical protein